MKLTGLVLAATAAAAAAAVAAAAAAAGLEFTRYPRAEIEPDPLPEDTRLRCSCVHKYTCVSYT